MEENKSMNTFDEKSEKEKIKIKIVDFDDGHSPGKTDVNTKLAIYENKNASNFITIFDNLVPDIWCQRAYDYAVKKGSPWGAYITIEEAMKPDALEEAERLWNEGSCEKALALRTVRAMNIDRGGSIIGKDLKSIHGTAVWSLCSGAKDEVRYHIDYGELYRYETNIIYPPVYGGTWHCSPFYSKEDIGGGALSVNVDGVEHYRKFGYKCRLSTPEEFQKDISTSNQWMTIPYRYNRGILFDGDFPHFATETQSIREGMKRVILGFNCFTEELKECNLRAPEHSDAFNRTIKLYQKMAAMGVPITNSTIDSSKYSKKNDEQSDGSKDPDTRGEENTNNNDGKNKKKGGINIEDIKKNPMLAKLLVKAAKTLKEKDNQTTSNKPSSSITTEKKAEA